MELDFANATHYLVALVPELVLTGWSLVVLIAVAWRHSRPEDARFAGQLTLLGFGLTAVVVAWMWVADTHVVGVAHMIAVDNFRFATDLVFLAAGALTVLMSLDYLEREDMAIAEYYPLLIFAVIGMMFLGGAQDLVVLFLGIELMSIPLYVLAGLRRNSPASAEAGFKYFILGAFASGFLIYGIALIFGATATTNLEFIGTQIRDVGLGSDPMLLAGVGLFLIGFGFKVAAVPFHMWAPDVYDGAPSPVTAFMATAVKAAAFAALARVALAALGDLVVGWQDVVAGLAITTMVAGNLVALSQRTLKRMLAYSSIAHAGYLLVAIVPASPAGAGALLFYLAAYTLMTIPAFMVLIVKGREGERDLLIDDLAGLARSHPWLALAMAVAMLSLLGFPGTAGFVGKWYILQAAVLQGHGLLATILVLTSVVSAGYYLPVIMAMYMKPEAHERVHAEAQVPSAGRFVLATTTALTLIVGFWPAPMLDMARDSAATIKLASPPAAETEIAR